MTAAWFAFLLGAFLATPIGICAGIDFERSSWTHGPHSPRIPRATATWKQRRARKRERKLARFRDAR